MVASAVAGGWLSRVMAAMVAGVERVMVTRAVSWWLGLE